MSNLFPRVLLVLFLQLNLACLLLLGAAFADLASSAPPPPPLAKPGCEDSCGNISVPYPFGTTLNCYLDPQFLMTCNSTHYDPPKLFLQDSNIEVTDIYLNSGEFRISTYASQDCYDQQRNRFPPFYEWIRLARFFISNTRNKFTAVGCDTYAVIEAPLVDPRFATGCLSLCGSIYSVTNGSCSGIGCCQTSIPKGVRSFYITVGSYANHSGIWGFNPCSYAFVAEENAYNFSSSDLSGFNKTQQFPVVIDWTVGNESCSEAKKNQTSYACKDNSDCSAYVSYDAGGTGGYQCFCRKGYEGNPYLPSGCRDIDECKSSVPSLCNVTTSCVNSPGTYNCSCPSDYEGDGWKNGTGCTPILHKRFNWVNNIALPISISISVLLLGGSWLYWGFSRRKIIKKREELFEQNGGILLQERLLSKREGSIQSAKLFTAEDLKKATNNYHESRVVGRGGQGTVYKGVLPDNTEVAIKKSQVTNQSKVQIQQFINEVIILSQINHRNVVRLLGCCLDTEVPLLVYELVANGALYEHIHNEGRHNKFWMTWENRLRIATETAGALSYLHSAASTPIIHRDVKSANILLDDNYVAKVADFGASKLIPIDQTQLTTLVQGTLGYLDPEYFHTSQLTEKSDVYSFGVLLVELLTGKKALCFARPAKEQNLARYFVSAMKDDCLLEIVGEQVIKEAKAGQLKEVAVLAKRCLKVNGTERPTMKEVASELEGIMRLIRGKEEMGVTGHSVYYDLPFQPAGDDADITDWREDSYLFGTGASSGGSSSMTTVQDSMGKSNAISPFDIAR